MKNSKKILKEGEEEQPRKFSNEVKKHFLEIVSTYNKYQEAMDRKSDLTQIAETLGGIVEAAQQLAVNEADDWFDKHTVKRNMNELSKLGKEFDKFAVEAKSLDQRLSGLYEDMGHILSRYYKLGDINEEEMKSRLGITESQDSSLSWVSLRRAKADLKQKIKGVRNDGFGKYTGKIFAVKGDKRIELKSLNDFNKYTDGYKWALGESKKSINENKFKPNQVQSAVNTIKKQLIAKWKKTGGYENFGEKEEHALRNKFDDDPWGDADARKITDIIDEFGEWAMNYDGHNESKKSIKESAMSELDIMAKEANDFKSFTKEVYKEYPTLPKNTASVKWLEDIYKNRTNESITEAINEYDEWKNTKIQAKNIFRMLRQKYNNVPDMKKGLEDIFKQNKTKPDQENVMWQEFNDFFKIKESKKSVNEGGDRYNIVDSNGKVIEIDLPKPIALKFAAKKKGWKIQPAKSPNESVNENFTPQDVAMIKKVVDKEKKLIGLSKIFDKMGWYTDFVMIDSVPPHLKIKKKKGDKQYYLLVNKRYVDKPDWVSGEIAGGLDESVEKKNPIVNEEDLIPGGLAQGKTLEDIANKHNVDIDELVDQFKKGIKVEMEHTTDTNVAKEISLDHLFEDPKYYDKLSSIENTNVNESNISKSILKKVHGKETDFYDELETLQDKLGYPKYMIWLAKELKSSGVDIDNDSRIKNKAEAEETLYNLSK